MQEELDLKVLKTITTDKVNALSFSYKYDHTIFDENSKTFAKLVIDYIKHFKAPPTRRTLIDRHRDNAKLIDIISSSFDEIEEYEYDINEFSYDVLELKRRYQSIAVEKIRETASFDDCDNTQNPEEFFNKLSLEISKVTSLDLERTYTQKPVGDYVEEFCESYDSYKLNPESFNEIKTGYSMIDTACGGFVTGDLIMVGGETNSGKALYIGTPIATPDGWTTMGELKVGDKIFDDTGNQCNVIAISGIMNNHDCYELEFNDGSKIIADSGHLWKVLIEKNIEIKTTDAGHSWKVLIEKNIEIKTTKHISEIFDKQNIEVLPVKTFNKEKRIIISVKKVESVPVQCIQVDSESHCFLCGKEMIPTHNSQLLNNLGKQIWMQDNTMDRGPNDFVKGHNILYFSLEMPYRSCFIRFLASLANVPQRSLAKSCLTSEEEDRVNKAYKFIKEYQESGYYFDIVDTPRNLTIEEIELRYQDALLRYRPDIVVVDYMGLMHNPAMAKEQDWLKLGAISCSLHEFARAYDCIVITAAQLTDLKRSSNGASDENRRVGVHRWGRSSLIMHNVNVGIQIETRPNEDIFPDLRVHIVKNRNGPLAKGSLIKNFANSSLIDVPFNKNEIPGDVSSSIPDLIRKIQESKNSEK